MQNYGRSPAWRWRRPKHQPYAKILFYFYYSYHFAESHWEKRIFRNEYMTGSADPSPVISAITLALLEGIVLWYFVFVFTIYLDTGWYQVDYSHAEYLEWGSGMGCSFIEEPCSKWKARKGYFCDSQQSQGCTSDRKAIGYCNMMKHSNSLPHSNRYVCIHILHWLIH